MLPGGLEEGTHGRACFHQRELATGDDEALLLSCCVTWLAGKVPE